MHNLSHITLFLTFGISYSYEARVKCKIGYDGGLITWISAKPTDWTPEVNYHISWTNGRTFSTVRRTSCSSLSRVLSTRSSCSTSPTSPTSLSQDYENLVCVQQPYEVRIWVNKHTETCHKPSYRTTNKQEETRYRLNCHEERCNRKRTHTHFLEDRNCEMQEGQNYFGLCAGDAQVKPYLEQQNLWELITAEHKVLLETCESGSNHRYAIVGQNLAVERSVMKQNFSRPTWNHFLEFGVNLWSWPWNYWKVYVDTSPFKKIWDCWIAVCWIDVKSFASQLQSTNQRSKLVETTKTYRSKLNGFAE